MPYESHRVQISYNSILDKYIKSELLFLRDFLSYLRNYLYQYCIKFHQQIKMDNKYRDLQKGYEEVVLNGQLLFQLAKEKINIYPHSSIGVISARDKLDLPIFGSGARVSSNLVMTAAHNIFNRKQGVFFLQKGFQATKEYGSSYKNIRFHPAAYEQFKEQQGYVVQSWRYPTQYAQLSCKNCQFYDYAILKLVDSIPKPIGGVLRPATYCHSCLLDVNNQNFLLIYGYPFDKSLVNYQPLNEEGTHLRIFQYGLKRAKRVRKIDKDNMLIYYEMSTLPGQSGTPIIFGNSYIGIHARGNAKQNLNGGRIFNKQILDWMVKWAEQLKGHSFQIQQKHSCKHQDPKNNSELLKQMLSKAQQSLRMKKYSQALDQYSKILELDSKNCEAIKGKGKCFHQMQNYVAAVEVYTQAIIINPKDSSAYAERAFAFYRSKQYGKCQKDCEEALKNDPNNSDAFAYKGVMNLDLKRYEQTLRDCNMAIKLNDKNRRALNWRGITYYDLKDYHKALADYTSAIQIDPKYTDAYNNRGITYKNLKDYDKALADYTTAIQIDPKFANAYHNRGLTYEDLKDYHKALADYTTAIQIDPKFAQAYHGRGNTYRNLKDYKKALSDFQSALSLSPNNPRYLIQIAICCYELGEAKLLAESLAKCEQSLSSKDSSQIQADFGISESQMDFIRSNLSSLKAKAKTNT